jgi:hypothetical protein
MKIGVHILPGFHTEVLGKDMEGRPGEKWPEIRRTGPACSNPWKHGWSWLLKKVAMVLTRIPVEREPVFITRLSVPVAA